MAKIDGDNYLALKIAIEGALDTGLLNSEGYEKLYRDEGHSPKRYRWDMFYRAQRKHGLLIGDGRGLHGYCFNDPDVLDDHIDTALRRFMREWGNTWGASQ